MKKIKFGDFNYFILLKLRDELKFRDYDRLGLENLDTLRLEVEELIDTIHKEHNKNKNG